MTPNFVKDDDYDKIDPSSFNDQIDLGSTPVKQPND